MQPLSNTSAKASSSRPEHMPAFNQNANTIKYRESNQVLLVPFNQWALSLELPLRTPGVVGLVVCKFKKIKEDQPLLKKINHTVVSFPLDSSLCGWGCASSQGSKKCGRHYPRLWTTRTAHFCTLLEVRFFGINTEPADS